VFEDGRNADGKAQLRLKLLPAQSIYSESSEDSLAETYCTIAPDGNSMACSDVKMPDCASTDGSACSIAISLIPPVDLQWGGTISQPLRLEVDRLPEITSLTPASGDSATANVRVQFANESAILRLIDSDTT